MGCLGGAGASSRTSSTPSRQLHRSRWESARLHAYNKPQCTVQPALSVGETTTTRRQLSISRTANLHLDHSLDHSPRSALGHTIIMAEGTESHATTLSEEMRQLIRTSVREVLPSLLEGAHTSTSRTAEEGTTPRGDDGKPY